MSVALTIEPNNSIFIKQAADRVTAIMASHREQANFKPARPVEVKLVEG